MNTIKNVFKKLWRGFKNIFGLSTVESVKSEEIKTINKCDCEKTGSNCDDPNCNCNCQCEVHHEENCNCECHNKEIEQHEKDVNQMTIDELINEVDGTTIADIDAVFYTDDTVTRDVLITELRAAGVTGISRWKKAELLAKFHEMNLKFPEVK